MSNKLKNSYAQEIKNENLLNGDLDPKEGTEVLKLYIYPDMGIKLVSKLDPETVIKLLQNIQTQLIFQQINQTIEKIPVVPPVQLDPSKFNRLHG